MNEASYFTEFDSDARPDPTPAKPAITNQAAAELGIGTEPV